MKLSKSQCVLVLVAALASLGVECRQRVPPPDLVFGSGGAGGIPSTGGTGGTVDPDSFFTRGEFESIEPKSVYFVGHSLLTLIPDFVAHMTNSMRADSFTFREQNVPGAPLRWHWEESGPGDGSPVGEWDFNHQIHDALASGLYTHVVVTDSVPRGGTEMEDETVQYLGEIVAAARAARPDVRVFYYETWPHITSGLPGHDPYGHDTMSPTRNLEWLERIHADAPMWERIVDRVNQAMPPGAAGHNVQLIPAGRVLASLVAAVEAGLVPGFDEVEDLFLDEIHTNHYAKLVVAATHVAIYSRRDPRDFDIGILDRWGNPYWNVEDWEGNIFQRPSDAAAAEFLRVVYEATPQYYQDR